MKSTACWTWASCPPSAASSVRFPAPPDHVLLRHAGRQRARGRPRLCEQAGAHRDRMTRIPATRSSCAPAPSCRTEARPARPDAQGRDRHNSSSSPAPSTARPHLQKARALGHDVDVIHGTARSRSAPPRSRASPAASTASWLPRCCARGIDVQDIAHVVNYDLPRLRRLRPPRRPHRPRWCIRRRNTFVMPRSAPTRAAWSASSR